VENEEERRYKRLRAKCEAGAKEKQQAKEFDVIIVHPFLIQSFTQETLLHLSI
jgi:hypothetical protein